ncbi:IMP dehydrogenase [Candidatus Pacearchaeota archaeon]|nr:IMP dehydrogenase [Candidatus Pacearchaeota archaeon]
MRIKKVLEKAREDDIALTFDDVRLRTGYSKTLPDNINTETKFSRNVGLKIPIVSAAMDTVTEYKLAIEMAKLGGLGVIHSI